MQRTAVAGWVRVALLSVLAITGAVLVGIVGVGYYYLSNPDQLKPLAAELIRTYTGRTLEISGPLRLSLSERPKISVEGVRLRNPAWAQEPFLLQADHLSLQLDLFDLMSGIVNILDFDARGVVLQLEQSAEGETSWDLFGDKDLDDDSIGRESGLVLLIQGFGLEDVTVHGRMNGIEPIELRIAVLTESTDSAGHLTLNGGGTLNDESWTLSGRLGPLEQLLAAGSVDLNLDLGLHTTELSVQGHIDEIATFSGVEVSLKLHGPDARFYGRFTRIPEAFEGDISLKAALCPAAHGYQLTAAGHIASFEVEANLRLSDLVKPDAVQGNVGMSGPDAAIIARALGIKGFPTGPFTLAVNGNLGADDFDLEDLRFETAYAQLSASGSFPEFPETDNGRASLRLKGFSVGVFQELLGLSRRTQGPYTLNADFGPETGGFRAELVMGSHTVQAEGVLGEEPGLAGLDISVLAFGDDLGEVGELFRVEELHGPYNAAGQVTISGNSLNLRNLSLTNHPFQITGNLTLPDVNNPTYLTLDFKGESPSLMEIGRYVQIDALPDRRVVIQGSLAARQGDYRLGNTTFDIGAAHYTAEGSLGRLDSFDGVDMDLKVSASGFNDILLEKLPEGYGQRPLAATYRLRGHEGAIEIMDFKLDVSDSTLRLDGYLTLAESRTGSYLQFRASGSRLDDVMPPLGNFQPSAMPYDFSGRLERLDEQTLSFDDFVLSVGRASATIDGSIDFDVQNKTNLKLAFRADSLTELGKLNSRNLPDIPLDLKSTLKGNEDVIEISDLTARWEDSDLQASGQIELEPRLRVLVEGASTLLSFDSLEKILTEEAEAPLPVAKAAQSSQKLIPDFHIPFDKLNALDADLNLSIKRLEGFALTLDDVELRAALEGGALEVKRLEYQDPKGSFKLSGYLNPREETGDFGLKVTGTNADLGFLVSAEQPPETIPRFSIDMDLHGTGSTIAEIASTLNGSILLSSDGGNVSNAALQVWTGDFLDNVINLLNPLTNATDPYRPMDCLVINATVDSGVLKLEPGFVMRTDKVNMFIFGSANLATETLDLALATQARQGIGLSAASITNPFFKVGGSFASPQLQVDTTSAALAYGVATATGGISILAKGFWDRLRGQRNPCPDFLPKS